MDQIRPQPIPTKHHIWTSYLPPLTLPSPCDGEMGIHHPNYVIKPEVRCQECVFFWTPLQGPGLVNRGTPNIVKYEEQWSFTKIKLYHGQSTKRLHHTSVVQIVTISSNHERFQLFLQFSRSNQVVKQRNEWISKYRHRKKVCYPTLRNNFQCKVLIICLKSS